MKCGECDEGYQCHACGAPLPDDHVFMAVCHTCRELATGTWAARAARWKRAARRLRSRWRRQYASSACNQKGATGWWLVEGGEFGRLEAQPMDRGIQTCHNQPAGYTYSAAEALAWLRDGALPQREG